MPRRPCSVVPMVGSIATRRLQVIGRESGDAQSRAGGPRHSVVSRSAKLYQQGREEKEIDAMARRFIATGAPGSGKAAALGMLIDVAEVISEAATDVNEEMLAEGVSRAELDPMFLPRIVSLQRQRRLAADGELQVHD